MSIHQGASSTWQGGMIEVHVGVSSAWQELTEVHVGASGSWEQVFGALAAPTGLTAVVSVSSEYDTIDCDWDTVAGADNYVLERAEDSGFSVNLTQVYSGASNSHSDDTCDDGDQYWYRVKAQATGLSDSSWSTSANDTTTLLEPVLSSLSAGSPDYSAINCTHTDGGSATETEIRCYISSTGPSSGFSLQETFAANSQSGVISPLSEGTTYWVKLCNYNSTYGESGFSSVLSRATEWEVPAAPTMVSVTGNCDGSMDVVWTDNSSNEEGFQIYDRVLPAAEYSLKTSVGPGVESKNITGYSASETVYFKVRAHRSSHSVYSDFSDPDSDTIPTTPGSGTASWAQPSEPYTFVRISWSGFSGADDYDIEIETEPAGNWLTVVSGTTGSFYDHDRDGTNGWGQPLGNPTSMSVTDKTDTTMDIGWTNTGNTGDGIRVYKNSVYQETISATATSYQATGLDPETEYTFGFRQRDDATSIDYRWRVRGSNTCGDGSWANTSTDYPIEDGSTTSVTDTTLALQPPDAPTSFSWNQSGADEATLGWTDNSDTEDGFRIEYALNGGGWTFVTNASPDDELYVHDTTGLFTGGDSVEYRVRAYNSAGNSSWATDPSDPQTWT